MSVIPPCNALKNSLKLPHCVVTRFHSCWNCTPHAASINFTDLCVSSNNVAIHNICTYSGSSIKSNNFFRNPVQTTHTLMQQLVQLISCCTFLQGDYYAHPQILDYKGRKHTAPHTYTAEVAYTVHFFQRGYSARPQILDYQGRKHTAPTHTLLKQPTLYISSSKATQHTHRF